MSPANCRSAAIILSGGKGLRLGSDIPKQYIELRGKPILGYTIEAFECSDVDEIIIVAASEYIDKCREIAALIGSSKVTAVIVGGAERYDSVLNGLRYLAGRDVPDIVLIHDGARPFIRPAVINEIIATVAAGNAAIAATPCTDTIKIADKEGFITSTTDRARTWAAQTPQAFPTEEIYRAYEKIIGGAKPDAAINSDTDVARGLTGTTDATRGLTGITDATRGLTGITDATRGLTGITEATRGLTGITDDAMVYQMAFPDRKVQLIQAGHDNFKITTADDMIRAESLLATRVEK